MDFDDILPHIGGFGKYQKLLIGLICLPASLPCSFFGFLYIFQIYLPTFKCNDFTNSQNHQNELVLQESSCQLSLQNNQTSLNYTHICISWVYDTKNFKSSAAVDFNMVCDRSWLTQLTVSLFYAGSLCGHIIFGLIIDRWGRRVGFFLCLSIEVFFGILIVFSTNIYMFMLCQFAIGLTIASIFDIPFVSAIELVGPAWRALITIFMCLCYSLGVVLFSIIAYFVRDWRTLTLIVDLPFLTFYIYLWFLPESIRWLIVKEKYKDAEKIIQKAARINRKEISPNFLHDRLHECSMAKTKIDTYCNSSSSISLNSQENYNLDSKVKVQKHPLVNKNVGIKDLFTHPNLRKKCAIISFAWIANVLSYVGIQNYLLFFDDLHLNFVLAALMELPGYIFLYFTLDQIGRKFPFSFSMLVSGISVLTSNFFATTNAKPLIQNCFICLESRTIVLILALIGKLGISTSFVVIYLYGSELYPTELRGTGMGVTLFLSRIFTIAVPFINYLGNTSIVLPTLIMGGVTTVAAIFTLLLPETINKKLPETIEESEKIGLDYSYFTRIAKIFPKYTPSSDSEQGTRL